MQRAVQPTGERAITGPYVDYLCTDQYTLTFTAPLVVDGRFLGVAGAWALNASGVVEATESSAGVETVRSVPAVPEARQSS